MSEKIRYHYKQSKTTGLWVVYISDNLLVKYTDEEIAKTDVALANECLIPVLDPNTPDGEELRLSKKFDLWRSVRQILAERGVITIEG